MFGISIKDYLILKSICRILYHCLYQWPLWETSGTFCVARLSYWSWVTSLSIFSTLSHPCRFSHTDCLMVSRQTKFASASAACYPPAQNIIPLHLQMTHSPHFIYIFYKCYLLFFKCYFLTLPLKCYLL